MTGSLDSSGVFEHPHRSLARERNAADYGSLSGEYDRYVSAMEKSVHTPTPRRITTDVEEHMEAAPST
jgi:hypothetical protein